MMRICATMMPAGRKKSFSRSAIGPGHLLLAEHIDFGALRHGRGRAADRVRHVEVPDRRLEGGAIDCAVAPEGAPRRRLDLAQALEVRVELEEVLAQLGEAVVGQPM